MLLIRAIDGVLQLTMVQGPVSLILDFPGEASGLTGDEHDAA